MVFVAVMSTHEVKRWAGESNRMAAHIVNTENSWAVFAMDPVSIIVHWKQLKTYVDVFNPLSTLEWMKQNFLTLVYFLARQPRGLLQSVMNLKHKHLRYAYLVPICTMIQVWVTSFPTYQKYKHRVRIVDFAQFADCEIWWNMGQTCVCWLPSWTAGS